MYCRRVSVRLSQAGVASKRLDESSWHGDFLPPVPQSVLRSGTWSQIPDFESFATASRWLYQQEDTIIRYDRYDELVEGALER